MKTPYLLSLLLVCTAMLQAQQYPVKMPDDIATGVSKHIAVKPPCLYQRATRADIRGSSSAMCVSAFGKRYATPGELIEIGKMANTFGVLGEERTQIACDPLTGNVAVIYRGNDRSENDGDGNTLYIRYSTNNGQTWSPQTHNIATSPNPRYPIVFLNPNEGADPFTSVLWPQVIQYPGGDPGFGAVYAMRSELFDANPTYSSLATPPAWSLPWQIVPDQSTGHLYTMAPALEPTNGAATGELFLLRSTNSGADWHIWPDLSTAAFTDDLVPQGYFADNLRLDISPDGSTMMLAFALIIESGQGSALLLDPSHEIAWRTSTDQGVTWSSLQRMKPSDIPVNQRPKPFDAKLTMAWDFDLILDYRNRPHFLTVLSADLNPFDPRDEAVSETVVNLRHVDSTFTCEITMIDGDWTILPIGPVRRARVDRGSFTALYESEQPYVLRAEPKWARNYDGTQIYAKWISPLFSWRTGVVAGQEMLFPDTLTQIYVNGRHVDSKSLHAWRFPWNFADPEANTDEADRMMRVTEFEEVGAKFTKMAYYAGPNGRLHIVFTEWGIGETYDDDPMFSDQTVWYVSGDGVELGPIGVAVEEVSTLPGDFLLHQNFPNPFNPSTEILFTLPSANHALLRVFDVLGREVAILVNQVLHAGTHRVSFDAYNLQSGVYVYRLESGSFSATKRMLLMK